MTKERNVFKIMEIEERVKQLIRNNQKIQATKEYREYTGVGLKEAKDYVDYIADQISNQAQTASNSSVWRDTVDLDAKIKQLLGAGNKIEAVKCYRDATGAGLAEAKTYVDQFDYQRYDMEPKTSLASKWLFILGIIIVVLIVWWFLKGQ